MEYVFYPRANADGVGPASGFESSDLPILGSPRGLSPADLSVLVSGPDAAVVAYAEVRISSPAETGFPPLSLVNRVELSGNTHPPTTPLPSSCPMLSAGGS